MSAAEVVRFEAVDGDRRVLVEFPEPVTTERAAGHAAVFRAIAEQMFRSGRAERARAAVRVVGEAGTSDGPTVTTGATSPTTEYVPGPSAFVPFEVESTFGVGDVAQVAVDGIRAGVERGSVLVEEPVGPPVAQAPPVEDAEVVPIGGRARGEQKAERAQRMAVFVEAFRMADGTTMARTRAGAEAAGIAMSTAGSYLREARDAGLIEDVAPDRVAPATGERAAGQFRPPVAAAPPSITPPRSARQALAAGAARRPATAPSPRGERLTPKERMDRFVETYQSSTLTGDKRVEQAAKAAGLATMSGASYLRQARKAGLLPDPLGSLAAAAGPITGGVA